MINEKDHKGIPRKIIDDCIKIMTVTLQRNVLSTLTYILWDIQNRQIVEKHWTGAQEETLTRDLKYHYDISQGIEYLSIYQIKIINPRKGNEFLIAIIPYSGPKYLIRSTYYVRP